MADRNGYIGRAPSDSSVVVSRQIFSPTGVTTDFTFTSGYTPGYLDLYLNGVRLVEGTDYTATDTSTINVLNGGAENGDVLEGVAYKAFNLTQANRVGIQSAGVVIGSAETLNFVGTGNTFLVNGTTIDVSISGGGGSAGAGGTWSNFDGVTGITTTKKVKIQNDLEVTGVTTSTGGFEGNLEGNVTGTVSGNAGSATVLAASRNIGGVAFNGSGDINLPGVNQAGNQNTSGTAAGLSGTPDITVRNIIGVGATLSGLLTYEDVTNIDSIGVVTARSGVQVGAGQSFGANGPTAVYYGDGSNLTNLPAAGLTTEALVSSGIVTTLNLTAAQDHKITASGITTITVSGGTEADSHTVRIINSGITTVGFSTYFLFPSGSAPSLPTADGAISLISFTVNRVGTAGTQLLAGASLNFS